jgi:CRISP-associated protein Cas1
MLSAPDFKEKQVIIALLSHGERLSFKNDNVIISNEEGIRHQSSCYRLFALFIVGHITITTGLLQRAKKHGFSIILLTHGFTPYGSWNAQAEGNILLRKIQYSYDRLDIAQHLVSNKIGLQLEMLKKRRKKQEELKTAIQQLKSYQDRLPDKSLQLKDILGIEGIASRVYFPQMFDGMNWKGRKPRVKHDITNLLLDIGYTKLFNLVDAILSLYGFDTYQGVYHQVFYQRKSLVCDLVEPFRPIVDQAVRKAHTLGQIHSDDFQLIQNQYRVFGKTGQQYSAILLKAILKHKMEMFHYIQQYYRSFIQKKPIMDFPIFELEK